MNNSFFLDGMYVPTLTPTSRAKVTTESPNSDEGSSSSEIALIAVLAVALVVVVVLGVAVGFMWKKVKRLVIMSKSLSFLFFA